MSRTPAVLNRILSLVLGLALLLGGGVLLDHRWDTIGNWPATADLSAVVRILNQPWTSWAAGAAAVVLVVLGLWLIAAQLRRSSIGRLRLSESNADGRLQVDARTLTSAISTALEDAEGIQSARVRLVANRSTRGPMVLARGTVDPRTDGPQVLASAHTFEQQVHQALGGTVHARLLLDEPRPLRGRATASARVQ